MFNIKLIISLCIFVPISLEEVNESELSEHLYMKLFKRQRAEHLDAIKNFQKISGYEKQSSLIKLMSEKIFTVIQDGREILENSTFLPGTSPFPINNTLRESLSNILENTALFSELILRFPDIAVRLLKKNQTWDELFQWSVAFSFQMKYLLDASTIKLLHLVNQELNYVERDINYRNPYRRIKQETEVVVTTKKKKKSIKKGPRLSNYEL